MEYNLEVNNLTASYAGSDFKLKDVSFNVPKGSIVGFVGENGAGKTTTIHSILNLLRIDGGSIKILGKEMDDQDIDIREKLGVVLDKSIFSPDITTKKLSRIMSNIYKQWDQNQFDMLVKKLNIPENKKIKEFSKGTTMKLSIAVAMSHGSQLLVLDEATSGLDPVVREQILDLFLDFVEDESNSILISSHITSDLEKIADYITFIKNGKIILTEKKDTLLYEYGIARCKTEQFKNVYKEDIISHRKRGYQTDVLVKDKSSFKKKYKDIVTDSISIDEVLLLLVNREG
ncbi:ABC transporter ATP-binding protein [Peptostreptococcus faecalis]|uniref:ABC transporter ATP-binding protein n=1 Tax=Peptostreptococcus faecalis TaxID=2045015 RepID=UPI0015E11506|nr:ABC transporter ATP-binding protein [Peptostreptococcus faecalis]